MVLLVGFWFGLVWLHLYGCKLGIPGGKGRGWDSVLNKEKVDRGWQIPLPLSGFAATKVC